MTASFFWHDYETFGANPRQDRPCQFAGIRTDTDLNPVGDPVELWCQPTDDMLPHPAACLITGITPQRAAECGMPEPQFIAAVLAELGKPGTCGVGYNSLRFDDEVTRHAAWRNFHDPYSREWRNGCSRWDIIDMVRLTYALRPDGIEWPLRDDGQPSFRLEHLAAANQLQLDRAHDALSDVHTTIALARLIRDRQPRLYDYVVSNRDKQAARSMLGLRQPQPVLHVSQKFPAAQGCLTVVLPLCAHPTNKNAVLVFDLRHHPQELLDLSAEDIQERIFTPTADLPEDVSRIPVKAVHINKCPVLAPLETLQAAQAQRLSLDLSACLQHADLLRPHQPQVAEKLAEVFSTSFETGSDPEQDLYGGFIGDADRRQCDKVLQSPPEALAGVQFDDPRLRELLFRYRARHHPQTLDAGEREEWQQWRQRRLEFAPDGGLTLAEFQQLVTQLSDQLAEPGEAPAANGDTRRVLADLQAWGERLQASL